MLAIFAYYAGIMLNAFTTHYAQNYAGIIVSSLQCFVIIMNIHFGIT